MIDIVGQEWERKDKKESLDRYNLFSFYFFTVRVVLVNNPPINFIAI